MRVCLFGSTGFVGRAVLAALEAEGHEVVCLKAPRLEGSARPVEDLCCLAEQAGRSVLAKSPELTHCDAVVNAAGLATPTSTDNPELWGANALLPGALAWAAKEAGADRFVHISSAAVYGSRPFIHEADTETPETPYGRAKLVGDHLAVRVFSEGTVVYRPTSVHGRGRPVTERLIRFARSRAASVSAPGTARTPQVLVENVGAAAAFLVAHSSVPTTPVVHPSEGLTTAGLLTGLAGGKVPRRIPRGAATAMLQVAKGVGRVSPKVGAQARRLEMVWFGQDQAPGWLEANGLRPRLSWDDAFDRLIEAL